MINTSNKSSGLQNYLRKLRISDENGQNKLLKDLSRRINSLSKTDLQPILEFLIIIENLELEVKLFSLLSMSLAANDSSLETIATYIPLYAKIDCILSKGLPLVTTKVLIFVSALVCASDAHAARRHLATLVRNQLRVSGVLTVMAALFVNSMMFPDTWQALCRCLAECCSDSQLNKTQCSYLIPSCVEKCLQGYSDVLAVLQSLLSGHPKNIQKFVDNEGAQIFNREMLQYITCLQLLSAVVKSSQKAAWIVCKSDVPGYLAEILQWNGPDTPKGQWCKIIVHNLESHRNISGQIQNKEEELNENVQKEKETTLGSVSRFNTGHANNDDDTRDNENEVDDADDTANLYRNVCEEVLYWNAQDNMRNGTKPLQAFAGKQRCERINKTASVQRNSSLFGMERSMVTRSMLRSIQGTHPTVLAAKHDETSSERETDYSFSFLNEERPTPAASNFHFAKPKPYISRTRTQETNQKDATHTSGTRTNTKTIADKSVQTNFDITTTVNIESDKSSINFNKFKPTLISTPKRREQARKRVNDMHFPKRTVFCNTLKLKHREPRRRPRTYKTLPVTKLTSKSVSARFFHALNESCTTFVKTVKGVFMPWKTAANANKDSSKSSAKKNAASPGYSFTDYMKKRDEILGVEATTLQSYERLNKHNPCKTCNDTEILKQKLASDAYLSKTVKKLKLGINLFGCDFKKISKTFWPNEDNITPTVLYNLYRKLILK